MSEENISAGSNSGGLIGQEQDAHSYCESPQTLLTLAAAQLERMSERGNVSQPMNVETRVLLPQRCLASDTGSPYPFPKVDVEAAERQDANGTVGNIGLNETNMNFGQTNTRQNVNGNIAENFPGTSGNTTVAQNQRPISACSSRISINTNHSFEEDDEEALITDGETPYFECTGEESECCIKPMTLNWGDFDEDEPKDEIVVILTDDEIQYYRNKALEFERLDHLSEQRALARKAEEKAKDEEKAKQLQEQASSDTESTGSDPIIFAYTKSTPENMDELEAQLEAMFPYDPRERVDLTDVNGDEMTLKASAEEFTMSYYPFWIRPDEAKSLAKVSDRLLVEKVIRDSGIFFTMTLLIKNISQRSITFKVQTCDGPKYNIEPAIGVIKFGETASCTICTKRANEWTYWDFKNDSVRILVSSFVLSGNLVEENFEEKEFKAAETFWKKHGTDDFPYAELHYINSVEPLELSYLDEKSIGVTAFQRYQSKFKFCFSLLRKKARKVKRKPRKMDLGMLFDQFSQDPGDLFIRDQVRSFIVNRDRMLSFAYGDKYNMRNLFVFTTICIAVLGITLAIKYDIGWMIWEWFESYGPQSSFLNYFKFY